MHTLLVVRSPCLWNSPQTSSLQLHAGRRNREEWFQEGGRRMGGRGSPACRRIYHCFQRSNRCSITGTSSLHTFVLSVICCPQCTRKSNERTGRVRKWSRMRGSCLQKFYILSDFNTTTPCTNRESGSRFATRAREGGGNVWSQIFRNILDHTSSPPSSPRVNL